LEISLEHVYPVWFIIDTYWERLDVNSFIVEYSRAFNHPPWKKNERSIFARDQSLDAKNIA
jgi:hypothetical protein